MVNAKKRTMWGHASESPPLGEHKANQGFQQSLQIRDVILDSKKLSYSNRTC